MGEVSFGILELGKLWSDENKFDDLGEVSFGICIGIGWGGCWKVESELGEVSFGGILALLDEMSFGMLKAS